MPTLLLVRHGRTQANTDGVLAGRTPGIDLDSRGREQVSALAEKLADVPLAAVVTSPLKRCRRTADALVAARGTPEPEPDERLSECDYGEWTGRMLADLGKEALWPVIQSHPSMATFPGGESLLAVWARAVMAVREHDRRVADDHGPDAVWAAVSHGDVIKCILADALGLHLDHFQRLVVDPASVSVVHYTTSRPLVVRINDAGAGFARFHSPSSATLGGGAGTS